MQFFQSGLRYNIRKRKIPYYLQPGKQQEIKNGSSREFVGKSVRDTSEPAVSQAAIRHNRSRWSLLFRLPFDSRQNLM